MRRRIIQPRGPALQAINVTPLIDVVMCLIIFFLIVGKLSSDRGMPVRLPKSIRGTEETSPTVMIVTIAPVAEGSPGTVDPAQGSGGWLAYGVTVQADGQMMTDSKSLEAAVRGRLAEAPWLSIQVRGDEKLSFGAVEPVLRACGQAGAKSVRFAAERAETGGGSR